MEGSTAIDDMRRLLSVSLGDGLSCPIRSLQAGGKQGTLVPNAKLFSAQTTKNTAQHFFVNVLHQDLVIVPIQLDCSLLC
jgi:hypothetical protein